MTQSAYIPLAIPDTGPREAANLQACIDENFVSTVGRFVGEFEAGVASVSGVPHAVAISSGTEALHIALRALGVGPGDLVILPSFTFIASANAISHSGAQPWLLDIASDSWTLCTRAVEDALARQTEQRGGHSIHSGTGKRVAAIMPVHTLGTPADLDALSQLTRDHNLALLADGAAAIGAEYKGGSIATQADITCFSFNGNKTITCGGGGMMVGRDEALLKRARHLTQQARVSPDYDHDEVGFNARMTNVSAAIGCAQLTRLDGFIAAKRRIRARYDKAFADLPGTAPFPLPEDRTSTCWFSGLVLDDPALDPKSLIAFLRDQQIEARSFWKPVHLQKPYAGAERGDLSYTDRIWDRIVTLPCSTSLGEADQTRVIEAVLDWFKPRGSR